MGPVAYPTTRSAYQYSSRESSMDPTYGAYDHSSHQRKSSLYHASNPGKPPPQYRTNLHAGEYYQQTVRRNSTYAPATAEDVILIKQATPGMHNFLGLPGGQDFDITSYQFDAPPMGGAEQRIDPSLIPHGHAFFHDNNHGDRVHDGGIFFGDTQYVGEKFVSPFEAIDPSLGDPSILFGDGEHNQDGLPLHDPHMNILRGQQEGWQVESMDAGSEFDNWMKEE
jgi:hypothetical protein